MHLRYLFFLLFTLFPIAWLNGQDPDLVTPVNNPFAETVRPVVLFESGQLTLKLVNGFRETVQLTQVKLTQPRTRSSNLLKMPVDVSPAETKYVNLDLRALDLNQEIRVVLDLSPRPPKQRSEFVFRLDKETNRFVEVEPEAGP